MMKRTVLIVDDQVVNRRILAKILEEKYEVMEAENGKTALDLLMVYAGNISAVLLDIVMPAMNGYEVLSVMSKDPVLSKIPVIVSSQEDGEDAELHALSLGAQDFIVKPYKADIIRHRLGNIIKLRETAAMINKAEKDELTGLYCKQFFIEKLQKKLDRNPEKQYDIICMGIERFRLVNDTYGTAKGDELLCHIADILREFSSETGICGRFNADMFYMLMPHKERYESEMFKPWTDRINAFPIDMDIKVHCGIYLIHDMTVPVSAMCDRAQLAAEKNRNKYNRNFCYYDDSIRQKLIEEQFITSTMQSALEQHQFQVYYQPKYDLNSEMVAGAEALVRWVHPERGFLSPGSFIPIFEKNGFITQLDRYVWEKACADIRSWMDSGYPVVAVSVNVSRADIYNPKLTDILLDLMVRYRIPMRYLHLEITESAYTENPDQIITVVDKLRNLGFVVEMDDFGSGYSSLNMLAEMPVDVLKLDMKFIQTETLKTSGKGILSFVISLAKWLNLAVVAEGVETAGQIASLRSMDCNYVQGFYYAKPMPAEDFETLIKTSKITEMICTSRTAAQYVHQNKTQTIVKKDRRMLVVDDIEINRVVIAATFADEYEIAEAQNGLEAWEYLKDNYEQVEIIMLDLLMPVMDGFQLLEKIKSDTNMKDIPIIITSQGDAVSEQRALDIRADDFISKPYNPDIIRHRVHNVMAGYRLNILEQHDSTALVYAAKEAQASDGRLTDAAANNMLSELRPHFDIVRLVDPQETMIYEDIDENCDMHACYSVWGRSRRCNNCISLRALENHSRENKLEYSESGLYFVISQYIPYKKYGAILEMVTKLEDGYVDNVFDKSLLYMKLDEINRQLERDVLTGVYNRRNLDENLENHIGNAKKYHRDLGIAMIDIDSFKQLNDTYGHLAGDEVLKAVAKMLEANIAVNKGDFVVRFGGDEFMVVCLNISAELFKKRIWAVSELIRHIILENGKKIEISISAGCISLSEFQDGTSRTLIAQADKRLYMAKEKGRGRVVAEAD